MSWSRTFESLDDFMHDRGTPDVPNGDGNQYVRARQAAELIIQSGCVGSAGKDLRVYLQGHANPDHEARRGWANDSVTVTVTQK